MWHHTHGLTLQPLHTAVHEYWYSVNVSHSEFMKCILLIDRFLLRLTNCNSRSYCILGCLGYWVVWMHNFVCKIVVK